MGGEAVQDDSAEMMFGRFGDSAQVVEPECRDRIVWGIRKGHWLRSLSVSSWPSTRTQICLPALTRLGESKLDCPTGLSPFFHLSLHAGPSS